MKDAWDRFLLIGVAAAVTVVSLFFAAKTLGFTTGEGGSTKGSGGSSIPDTGKESCDEAASLVTKPRAWDLPELGNPAKKVPLLVSIPVIELDGKAGDPRDPTFGTMRPPVPNTWLIDNNLDYTKRSVLSFDPDGDGFTNLEEWRGKTNPKDSGDHPPFIKKLEFVERIGKAYSITFQGDPGSGEFQFRREANEEYKKQTFFVKKGQTSKDGQIRVDDFAKAEEVFEGVNRFDRSVLTLTYIPTGEQFKLTKRVRKDIYTYYAMLDFTLSEEPVMEIKKGSSFRLPNDKKNYKLVDVTEDVATVEFKANLGALQTELIAKRDN